MIEPVAILDRITPISITSCMGKVLEHIILARLMSHLNSSGSLPHSMIGFIHASHSPSIVQGSHHSPLPLHSTRQQSWP